ncbi:hypothetical protein K488DRAFT_86006 [Vararia minispora EC-137]|uniref:Uncharacterized protein n=1 Tax=Vararia minispora EC-137 TaxID=1314806 RepID=A0ACB8QK85_9AGAM|nr:hypothetical protein K488DRAFT_86006 [Vararia minispora EC-137]
MLAAPAGPAQGRISQLLPSVTCSTCGDPVPLSDLADHVCKPAPAPSLSSQPSKTSLLTQRINAMTSRNPRESAASQATSRSSYSTHRSVSSTGTARAPSPVRSPSPALTVRSQPPPQSSDDRHQRGHERLPSGARTAGAPSRSVSPASVSIPRSHSPAARPRAPSTASYRSRVPSVSDRGPPPSIPRAPSAASTRSRAPSNASARMSPGPGLPFTPRRQASASSTYNASSPPAPPAQIPPLAMRKPSFGSPQPPARVPPLQLFPGQRGPSPAPRPGTNPPPSPHSHTIYDERDIDTKTGGEAGMAGVGRRGFAAAARAAMFAAHHAPPGMAPYAPLPPSIGTRRPNAPPFLDIGATIPSLPPLGSMGSPLSLSPSPHSPVSSHPQPRSLSPHSPGFAHARTHVHTPSTATLANSGSTATTSPTLTTPPSPTPTNASILRLPPAFNKSEPSPVSTVPFPTRPAPTEPITPTDPSDATRSLFFENENKPTPRPPRERVPQSDDDDDESIDDMALRLSQELEDLAMDLLPSGVGARSRPLSPLSDTDSDDGGGLAYAASDRSSVLSHRRAPTSESVGHNRAPSALSIGHHRTPSAQSQSTTHRHTPTLESVTHRRTPSTQSVGRTVAPLHVRGLSLSKSKSQPVTPTGEHDPSRPFTADAPPVPALDLATALRGPAAHTHARGDSRASNGSVSGGHRRTGSRGFGPTLDGPDTGTGPVRAPPTGHGRSASSLRGQVDGAPGAWGIVRARTATGSEAATRPREREEVRRGGTISGAIGNGGASGSGSGNGNGLQKERERVRTESGRKRRQCVRCGEVIEDGRWVKVESGNGVLCEKCWKGMYLPKCRRCGRAIEKQAVSSSDGQLKGKYHRECFNCTTCQKPFPDKEFYVFDGSPYCAYHYHEANGSLCSAPACGMPIEGPCAVSHSGARYHPEHLTCEFVDSDEDDEDGDGDDGSDYSDEDEEEGPDLRRRLGRSTVGPGTRNRRRDARMRRTQGGRCTARLEEYWEVDGRMLCERHMRRVMGTERMRAERAQRRVTRFIDLNDFR